MVGGPHRHKSQTPHKKASVLCGSKSDVSESFVMTCIVTETREARTQRSIAWDGRQHIGVNIFTGTWSSA